MSNAQLTMESLVNVAARGSFALHCREIQPRSKVCRSLFGPVDHEDLKRNLDAKLREISELDQKRWNFNFAAGTPLDGDYDWEEASYEASPAFYQESVQGGKRRVTAVYVRPSEERENTGGVDSDNSQGRLLFPNTESIDAGKPTCGKVRRKTTARLTTSGITDFYVRRNNLCGLKRRECESEKTFTSLNEQTPRKRIR